MVVAPKLKLPLIVGLSITTLVFAPPNVKVLVELESANIAMFCSNLISTVFVPSPIKTSSLPLPIIISPTALLKTRSLPLWSILPALAPAEVVNCIWFSSFISMLCKNGIGIIKIYILPDILFFPTAKFADGLIVTFAKFIGHICNPLAGAFDIATCISSASKPS